MNRTFALLFAIVLSPCISRAQQLHASQGGEPSLNLASPTLAPLPYSSSAPEAGASDPEELPAAPSMLSFGGGAAQADSLYIPHTRPFSGFAIAAKIGTGGIGFDVATPLSSRFNLRGGASFFSFNTDFNEDGIQIDGTLELRTVAASLDWFPFGGSFHISPGITVYNNTHITASAAVPGGQTFTLNDTDYTSSTVNPITGSAALNFGNKVAPRITVGFGNMIPRSKNHFSFPFEIGFQYIAQPTVTLNLQGTACDDMGDCSPVATDPTTQSNLQAEQKELTDDLNALRFFPIVSIGVSYSFGR